MSYADRTDIDNVFGTDNVTTWADLNNSGDAGEVAARVAWALDLSYSRLNARLRGGPYVVPLSEPVDEVVVNMQATMAGLLLHDSRGYDDSGKRRDPLGVHRKVLEADIRMVRAGHLRLDAEGEASAVPAVLD